jgi:voltage-gated potassium channel
MLKGFIASFIVVSLCVIIHIVGLVLLMRWLMRHPLNVELRLSAWQYVGWLTRIFGIITLLHLGETLIWAAFYDLGGQFKDFETSWYFSMACYATIGYGDVVLPPRWRLIGGVEGINGVLLCGLSTAFLFGVFNQMLEHRFRQKSTAGKDATGDQP